MPNYSKQCEGCSGEDCVCCPIFMEAKADAFDDRLAEMDFWDDYDYPEENNPDDIYADSRYVEDEREQDTPLGELYGNGFDNDQ